MNGALHNYAWPGMDDSQVSNPTFPRCIGFECNRVIDPFHNWMYYDTPEGFLCVACVGSEAYKHDPSFPPYPNYIMLHLERHILWRCDRAVAEYSKNLAMACLASMESHAQH